MSYTIAERYKDRWSEDKSTDTLSKEYELNSSERLMLSEANAAFINYLNVNNILPLNGDLNISRYEVEVTEESYDKQWVARVEWSGTSDSSSFHPEQPVNILKESFSTKGGTARVTQAYSETRYAVGNNDTPNMGGGIGWNGDEFEGCDIVCPAFSFTLDKTYDYDKISINDKIYWSEMTGCVNSGTFRGHPAGTVLFMGMTGKTVVTYDGTLIEIDGFMYKKATITYECQFEFRCQPNKTNYSVAGRNVSKGGWQYVWVLREMEDDSESGKTIARPLGVYVNGVYHMESFENLI